MYIHILYTSEHEKKQVLRTVSTNTSPGIGVEGLRFRVEGLGLYVYFYSYVRT